MFSLFITKNGCKFFVFPKEWKCEKNVSHSDDHSNLKMAKVPLWNQKYTKKNWLRSFTSTLQKCQPSLIWLWRAAIVMTRRHFYIIYSLGRKYLKNGGRHYYKLVLTQEQSYTTSVISSLEAMLVLLISIFMWAYNKMWH